MDIKGVKVGDKVYLKVCCYDDFKLGKIVKIPNKSGSTIRFHGKNIDFDKHGISKTSHRFFAGHFVEAFTENQYELYTMKSDLMRRIKHLHTETIELRSGESGHDIGSKISKEHYAKTKDLISKLDSCLCEIGQVRMYD